MIKCNDLFTSKRDTVNYNYSIWSLLEIVFFRKKYSRKNLNFISWTSKKVCDGRSVSNENAQCIDSNMDSVITSSPKFAMFIKLKAFLKHIARLKWCWLESFSICIYINLAGIHQHVGNFRWKGVDLVRTSGSQNKGREDQLIDVITNNWPCLWE